MGWNWGKCGGEGEARTPVRFPAEGEFEGADASESLDRAIGAWWHRVQERVRVAGTEGVRGGHEAEDVSLSVSGAGSAVRDAAPRGSARP